jgi:hypothetical protein
MPKHLELLVSAPVYIFEAAELVATTENIELGLALGLL